MKKTLKELRARKNETQYTVAKNIGVSTATYNNWEKYGCNAPISKCIALANYFSVSIDEVDFFLEKHLKKNQMKINKQEKKSMKRRENR